MDLQLDLSLSTNPVKGSDPNQDRGSSKKKRSFDEAFSGPTFPLLIRPESNRNAEKKDDFVVGWPPVKSWRKQLSHHNRRVCATNYVNVENRGGGGGGGRRGSNYMYVKVKIEGVGIARKVDLSVHRCYQTLVAYLVALFGKCQEEYMLIYQNKEGDWLHARDVTWESWPPQLVFEWQIATNGAELRFLRSRLLPMMHNRALITAMWKLHSIWLDFLIFIKSVQRLKLEKMVTDYS